MNAAAVVFLKECRESLRDRRVLLNALLIGPLLAPLLFVLMVRLTLTRTLQEAEAPLPVCVIGAAYAPNLIAGLAAQGVQVLPAVTDPERAIRTQQLKLVLVVPAAFDREWRAGRPAQLQIIFDSSHRDSAAAAARLRGLLAAYGQRTAAMRLMVRGLAPTLTAPLMIASRDQATPAARGALLLAMLPYFLILSALLGGMWLAIDATAGERERGSLEPLLANPVSRAQILAGKLLAVAAFSLASLALALLAFVAAGSLLPTEQAGMSFSLGPAVLVSMLLLMTPLVLLLVIAQVLVTSGADSVREAQTWLGLLQLVPVIPSVVLALLPLRPTTWMYAVPLLGQQISMMQLLRGERLPALGAGLSALATLLVALLLLGLARRAYDSERLAVAG